MHKRFIQIAAILGALAVILGAFGAHTLKEILPINALNVFETGVRYHFYHVIILLIAGMLYKTFPSKWIRAAGYLLITGIVLFSGSLYALTAMKAMSVEGFGWLGAITPLGGVAFVAGWVCIFFAVSSNKTISATNR